MLDRKDYSFRSSRASQEGAQRAIETFSGLLQVGQVRPPPGMIFELRRLDVLGDSRGSGDRGAGIVLSPTMTTVGSFDALESAVRFSAEDGLGKQADVTATGVVGSSSPTVPRQRPFLLAETAR